MSGERAFKEDINYWLMMAAGVLLSIILFDWAVRFFPDMAKSNVLLFIDDNVVRPISGHLSWLRFGYVFFIVLHFWANPWRKNLNGDKWPTLLITGFVCAFFISGYSGYRLYDMANVPVLAFLVLFMIMRCSSFLKPSFKEENIFGLSNQPMMYDNKLVYLTDRGKLGVHSVEQHIMVLAGTGAGKGGSITDPSILQNMEKGNAMIIYDAKGDLPMTRVAYTCKLHLLDKNKASKQKLYVFDISNPRHSYRINVLSREYINKDNFGLVVEIMSGFLKNLNPQWSGQNAKLDHWYEASLAVWTSLCMRFLEDEKLRDHLSFPLLTEMIMSNRVGQVLSFIEDGQLSKKMLSPIYLSSQGNMRQFTSEFSSAMGGLSKVVSDKNLYWLLSKNEIDLANNTEGKSSTICIGGNLAATDTYTPFVATILNLAMEYMRAPKGPPIPSFLLLDEINTIFLEHLPRDANIVRSNKVGMMFGLQSFSMLEDKYGTKKANNLLAACGNQFFGMSNITQNAEILEKMLGTRDIVHTSMSRGDSGASDTQSLKDKKVISVRDVVSQERGQFSGKIANGKPPFFKARFQLFKLAKNTVPKLPEFVKDAYDGKANGQEELTLQGQIDKNFKHISNLAEGILAKYPDKLAEENQYAGQD